MPSNVEIKAVLSNPQAAHAIAARLSDSVSETIHQEDIFFRCDGARLKLRILGPGRGELIRYERPDIDGARLSRYSIARTPDPENLRKILTHALGVTGSVKKTRTVYFVGQTRVHIDQVQNLGRFPGARSGAKGRPKRNRRQADCYRVALGLWNRRSSNCRRSLHRSLGSESLITAHWPSSLPAQPLNTPALLREY